MKKSLFVGIVMVLSLVGTAVFAVEPVKTEWASMIVSGPALRSYLEGRSVQAYVSISGEHVYEGSGNYAYTNVDKAYKLEGAVRRVVLNVEFDPDFPTFWENLQYVDEDWNTTIYGFERVTAKQDRWGDWIVPTTVTLRVPDYMVSLPIPDDVSYAYVSIYDSEGRIVGQRHCEMFTVGSGRRYIRYPGTFTGDQLALRGLSGDLVIVRHDQDGRQYSEVIDVGTGSVKTTAYLSTSLDPQIEGRVLLATNQNIFAVVESHDSVGINPYYVLPITAKGMYTIRAKTSEGEVSPVCHYRRVADENNSSDSADMTAPVGEVVLGVGTYHIWFEWKEFHENKYLQMWDYYATPVVGGG